MPEVSDATEEVVDGEIIIMPPAKWKHALILENIKRVLDAQLNRATFLALTTEFGLIIRKAPLTSRVPDLAVFELSTLVERDGYIHSAPQFLVEVLSPANTRREMARKIADYASIGVPEVWLISPEGRTVEILRLQDGGLQRAQIVAEGVVTLHQLPNVRIDIATIWPD